jgi:hypothetical protein
MISPLAKIKSQIDFGLFRLANLNKPFMKTGRNGPPRNAL